MEFVCPLTSTTGLSGHLNRTKGDARFYERRVDNTAMKICFGRAIVGAEMSPKVATRHAESVRHVGGFGIEKVPGCSGRATDSRRRSAFETRRFDERESNGSPPSFV